MLAAGQALTAFLGFGHENRNGAYLLRLAAFCLILGSIIHKNFTNREGP